MSAHSISLVFTTRSMSAAMPNSADGAVANPPKINPYDLFAEMAENLLEAPVSPVWSRRLKIAILVLYFVMFFQATYLLYQRFRINPRFKLRRNTLGLIVVDISKSSALVYIFYSPPTIYTTFFSLFAEGKYQPRGSTTLVIFCHKFFPLLLGSWAFMSFCASQCAMILWNSNLAFNVNRDRLQSIIKWVYNTFFVCAALVPLPLMTLTYVEAFRKLRKIESTIMKLSSMLRSQADAYDSNIRPVIPSGEEAPLEAVKKLGQLRFEVVKALRRGAVIYCVDTALLVIIYAPLLWFSFRGLYERSPPSENVEAVMGPIKQVKKTPLRRKLNRDRRRLVLHALCVYASTALHLPPLILMLTHNFLANRTKRQFALHGLNDPIAIFANIILLILNISSHHIIRAKKKANKVNPQSPPPSPSPNLNPGQQKGILKDLNAGSPEGSSIPLHNIHIALNNLEDNVKYHDKDAAWGPGDLHRNPPREGCDSPVNDSIC